MGRPKVVEPRKERLNLSFTLAELDDIKRRAQALGMRPAHFGRGVLLDTTKNVVIAQESDPATRLLHLQLVRVGSNLNQMVKRLHALQLPLPADAEPLLRDIREIIERLAK